MTGKHIILLATRRPKEFGSFVQTLEADDQVMLIQVASAREALDMAIRVVPAVVIIDQGLDDSRGLALARQLLQVNAFIHTAVISDMDEASFHEYAEGLGVLMRLPLVPDGGDAGQLLTLLRNMTT